jgi:toxin FitB
MKTPRHAAVKRTRQAREVPDAAIPQRIVLDSSCWMEFFAGTDRAKLFAPTIDQVEQLVVPVITIHEIVKKLAREAGEEVAAHALGLMQRGEVIAVDLGLAVDAALLGLPLADSLIYATARRHGAELWTQDADFGELPGVRFFAKHASL